MNVKIIFQDEDRSKEEGHEAVKIKTEPPDTTEVRNCPTIYDIYVMFSSIKQ